MKKRQTLSRLVPVLFLLYLVVLVWIILFKLSFSIRELNTIRSVNLIPFYYADFAGTRFHFKEVLENVLIFAPFGIYLCMLKHESTFPQKAALMFGASLALETAQFILSIGASDITDLITNTLGGILGIGIYHLFVRLLGNRERANTVMTILAAIVTVLLICFLSIILFICN